MRTRNWFIAPWGRRVGFQTDTIYIRGQPYMDRRIVYLGVGGSCLRLHKFYRGDDDRAPHNHPWNFLTFPLSSYTERYWTEEEYWLGGPKHWVSRDHTVRAFRLHLRAAQYRHMVLRRADSKKTPFWTIVFAYGKHNTWGFWPTPETFVYWRLWK